MSRHGRHGGHGGEIAAGLGLAGLAGIAGGTYKFAEFLTKAKRLHDVGSENAVFVRISDNVRSDLKEVERLLGLREVREALRSKRAKVLWIQDTMGRVRGVLEDMDKYTGRVEGDVEKRKGRWWTLGMGVGSGVGWRHRLRWVLDEHEKLDNRTLELGLVHQSLMEVMSFLGQFEAAGDRRRVEFDTRREYIDAEFDEPRERDVEVHKEKRIYDEREHDRYDQRDRERSIRVERERDFDDRDRYVHVERERDFVEGRRIEMVDLEAPYGYGGGEGPRIGTEEIQYSRRTEDFEEEDERTVYKKKTIVTEREREEPHHDHHHHGHWVRKKVHVHHGPHGEVDKEVVREEHPGHRSDHRHGHETEVYRERREYESDDGSIRLRTHWPSSRL